MADNTSIEWARHPVSGRGASWNPLLARRLDTGKLGYHCEHVSPGCVNCYSEVFNGRSLPNRGTGLPFKPGHRKDIDVVLDEKILTLPLRWKAPRGIFAFSMTDLFGEWVTDEMIDRIFAVMALCPQHVFMVLTKRPERMRAYLSAARAHPVGLEALGISIEAMRATPKSRVGEGVILQGDIAHLKVWPLPNVWLGTSAEDQARADERIPHLLATPAAMRFISAEPLLGPIDLRFLQPNDPSVEIDALAGTHGVLRPHGGSNERLDWVIVGGESGTGARPFHVEWAESLLAQCRQADVACFVKQMGANPVGLTRHGLQAPRLRDRKGGDWEEWPEHLRVREFPEWAVAA